MNLVLVDGPVYEPVALPEMKAHLRVDWNEEDALIMGYVAAAREAAEDYTRRALSPGTWRLTLDGWPGGRTISLPKPPLIGVDWVRFYDGDEVEHTLDEATYQVDTASEPGRILLRSGQVWPSAVLRPGSGVVIQFRAGYGVAPERARQAILLMGADFYEQREEKALDGGRALGSRPSLSAARRLLYPLRFLRFWGGLADG